MTKLGEETETYSYKLPASVRENAKAIDEALVNIRVCDPAVGSGAFLVGMMTEIIRVRNTISSYLVDGDRSIYTFKHHAIQNSLYGVDIDPGATEIAKLRLWLSLIVDEQDIKRIKPLPNLDYKIMQGNSLLEEYEGIKLFDEELFTKSAFDNTAQITEVKEKISEFTREFLALHSKGEYKSSRMLQLGVELKRYNNTLKKLTQPPKVKAENKGLFDQMSEAKQKADELKQLQREFFNTAHKKEKDRIKKQIETLTWEFIEATLQEQGKESLMREIEKFRKTNVKPFFIWKLNFSEIYESKNGFDLVIGNPPYLRIQGIQKVDPELAQKYKQLYQSATGAYDLYVLFLERGLTLLNDRGTLNYILPHKWVNSAFGLGIRRLVHSNKNARKLISFGAYQVFNASNYTSLLWLTRKPNESLEYYAFSRDLTNNQELEEALKQLTYEDFNPIDSDLLGEDPWVLTDGEIGKVLTKLFKQPLRVKDIFVKIFQGIATSKDSVYFLKDCIEKEGLIEGYSEELEKRILIENGLVKPLLRGEQIHRYVKLRTSNYVVFPYLVNKSNQDSRVAEVIKPEYIQEHFPYGWKYLMECEKPIKERERGRLSKDKYWYKYIYPKNISYFEQQKIITPEISLGSNMTLDDKGKYYHNTKCYSLIKNQKIKEDYRFYLGILNSRLMWFFLNNTGYVLRGGYFTFKTNYLEPFPLPKINGSAQHDQLVRLVDEIYNLTSSSNSDPKTKNAINNIEQQINSMVYTLYDLTAEEIAIVEGGQNV